MRFTGFASATESVEIPAERVSTVALPERVERVRVVGAGAAADFARVRELIQAGNEYTELLDKRQAANVLIFKRLASVGHLVKASSPTDSEDFADNEILLREVQAQVITKTTASGFLKLQTKHF